MRKQQQNQQSNYSSKLNQAGLHVYQRQTNHPNTFISHNVLSLTSNDYHHHQYNEGIDDRQAQQQGTRVQQMSRNERNTAFRFGSIKRNNKQQQSATKTPIISITTNIDTTNKHILIPESPAAHSQQPFRPQLLNRPNTKLNNNNNNHQLQNYDNYQQSSKIPAQRIHQYPNDKKIIQKDKQKQSEEIKRYFNNQSEGDDEEYLGGQEIQFKNMHKDRINYQNQYVQESNMKEVKKNGKASHKNNQFQSQQFEEDNFFDRRKVHQKDRQNIDKYLQSQSQSNNQKKKNDANNSLARTSPKMSKKAYGNAYDLPSNPSSFADEPIRSYPTRYGPGGIQTLQFNPQKQKLIILDSKQTESYPPNHNQAILAQFCDPIQIPALDMLPAPEHTPDQLVSIAKSMFSRFGCHISDQVVINVRKYKNCVHFSVSNQQNILYHYENGKLYFGAWKIGISGQGEKYGQGIQILPGKYKFKGFFLDGKKSGAGTLIGWDNSAYVGQWQNGVKSGAGRQLDSEGIIYEGEWKDGKKSGYGKLFNNGRLQFEGVFQKGLKNGYGKQYFENGDKYDGNYVNHKFEGKGTYDWHTGATYTGDFKEGRRNGFGVWKSSGTNCDIYEGQYFNDKKHGHGVYKWSNGSVYEGNFKDDLKHGEGTIVYENGKVAHLTWKNGKAEKKIQRQPEEQQQQPRYNHQLSQRKLPSRVPPSQTQSQSKKSSNFILRNRPSSRSTQNLQSAHSNSTRNSHPTAPKGITFNTRPVNKLLSKVSDSKVEAKIQSRPVKDEVIRLRFDNKQFEKALGKNWDKNFSNTYSGREGKTQVNKRPQLPRDRPYQGIQSSSNINMDM